MLHRRDLDAMLTRQRRAFAQHPRDPQAILVASTRNEDEPLTLRLDGPILTIRVRVAAAENLTEPTMKRMLILNAQVLIHAAFGIRGDDTVLEASLATEHFDEHVLSETLAEIDLVRDEGLP